jgi:glycosyltransferase involved in cell wall biosynthesis
LFRPLPRDESLANELGLAGRFNIVYAGNLGPLQGLETVVRAAATIRDRPRLQIVLVGTGVDEQKLKSLAGELRADNVRFIGRRPLEAMPALNAIADVLLIHLKDLPFFAATVPSKTQVALASGRPILMAVAGDAAAIVRDARAGLAIEPENVVSMASAFVRLHDMPRHELEELGQAGHRYYLREMSLGVGTARMAELFTKVS